MTLPRLADASDAPCQMRLSHNPTPVRTQSHHRFPVFLQKRLWGEVRLEDRWDLCGTDHDSTHTWLGFLLGEHYEPKNNPGLYVKREAEMVIEWYEREKGLLAPKAFGEGAFGEGPFGGGQGLALPDEQWDGIE